MKKQFTRYLITAMAVCTVIIIISVFMIQFAMVKQNEHKEAKDKLVAVEEKLQSNDEMIERLTRSVGENNLAKSRAFADILKQNPELKESYDSLMEICERLMVDELHVIDADGIITHSTVPEYVGFDMGSGEQSAAFLPIIDDPSIELVQEPQRNASEGKIIQYIGVARKDETGFVQVGIQPHILEETLSGTEIETVFSEFDYGKNGYVFAVSKEDNTVLAEKHTDLIGKDSKEAGFPQDLSKKRGTIRVGGQSYYCVSQEYGDMYIGTMKPFTEYFSDVFKQTLVVSICIILMNFILVLIINRFVSERIVKGIEHIEKGMGSIAGGDFDTVVSEEGNPEFESMSRSINSMVQSIRDNLSNNRELLQTQQSDMEKSQKLILDIKDVCGDIDAASKTVLKSTEDMNTSNSQQTKTVQGLRKIVQEISAQLEGDSKDVENVSKENIRNMDELEETRNKINLLSDSMAEITKASTDIEMVIQEINSIAEQTNLLSLNASIEAARAGEAGKGFAVVASEVGKLAMQSSKAAEESGNLIRNSIAAVENGTRIAEQAVDGFTRVADRIKDTSKDVERISTVMTEHAHMIAGTEKDLDRISDAVDRNMEIASKNEENARSMTEAADRLYNMLERDEG